MIKEIFSNNNFEKTPKHSKILNPVKMPYSLKDMQSCKFWSATEL